MEITEGNKLIAEFMGYPKAPEVGSYWDYDRSLDAANKQTKLKVGSVSERGASFTEVMPFDAYGLEYFQDGTTFIPHGSGFKTHLPSRPYHESWDWLMQAVETIEQQSHNKEQFSVKIQDSYCAIYNYRTGRENIQCSREGGSKINCTWQAVVAFIQWYNQQEK